MIAQLDPLYIKMRPAKVVSRLISYGLFEGRPLTTRGRWINPLVFALFRAISMFPAMSRVEKPIFILGTGRSGTTVLGVVLSMHRHVGYLNEPKALWHAIHPREDIIGSYSEEDAFYRLTEADATDEVRLKARRLFGAYLAGTLSRRVVDKYPELVFRVPFVRAIFPDARFLFLVRNGWDTCQSIQHWSRAHGSMMDGESSDWWGLNNRKWRLLLDQVVGCDPRFDPAMEHIREFRRHVDMAAVEWITTMNEGLRLTTDMDDSVLMVRYEELTARPGKTLRGILDFCGLPWDPPFVEYGKRTLRSARPRSPVELHPCIMPLFEETMIKLDYPV